MTTKPKPKPPATCRPVSGVRVEPVEIVTAVVTWSGSPDFVESIRKDFQSNGMSKAIKEHDNEVLFDWLMGCFSYQGVSDAVATGFIDRHGNLKFADIADSLTSDNSLCPKLKAFQDFDRCGYRKNSQTCSTPKFFKTCPLPTHPLRKGQLNQAGYSLFLFIRDRCDGDLVSFIDRTLKEADRPDHPDRLQLMSDALTVEIRKITGVSDKLINMTFADLLIGGDRKRKTWFEVGSRMIAVDTLVHNFLTRTGILYRLDGSHPFGPRCYSKDGCAFIIDQLARDIDGRTFDQTYPAYFPRFIQHALWQFCSESGDGICNGRQIDDTDRCGQSDCPVYSNCGRVVLNPV